MEEKPVTVETVKKPRRHWYQFGLRTLLIFVTLAGCGFAWIGLKVRTGFEQRRIVSELQALGARVEYDHEDSLFFKSLQPPKRTWLDHYIAIDFLPAATGVYPSRYAVGKALHLAAQLPQLDTIDLTSCDVFDTDLAELRGLSTLKECKRPVRPILLRLIA
jgi:hypothetical protein